MCLNRISGTEYCHLEWVCAQAFARKHYNNNNDEKKIYTQTHFLYIVLWMQYNQRKIATLAISERTKKKLFISPGFCTETPNHKIIGIKWIHISFDSRRGRNERLLEFLKWNRWHGPCWVKTFDGNSLRQVCNLAGRQNSGDSYFCKWMLVTMENFGSCTN